VAEQTGLEPERVRLCFAGACVIEGTRAAFGLSAIQASDAGVREGLLLE
jgi:exopolyphosphatase/pppGpp-phosphohydrolase